MHFSVSLGLMALLPATFSRPITPNEMAVLGSKHNLYLVTCTPKCVLGILCTRQTQTYTAVLFYANGAVDTLPNTSPTYMSTISSNPPSWEGASYSANLDRYGLFHSSIDKDAGALAKGQIAGSAKLEDEDFVCFKDGETTFTFSADLGLSRYTCKASYWCPSIQV
jgi:hypothetical protein